MKKVLSLLLGSLVVISAFSIFAPTVMSQTVWTKYGQNPLNLGSDVHTPWVIRDGNTYKMWYSSTGDICYATSSNGISWTTYGQVLRKNPSSWDAQVGRPSVIKDGLTYKMWYVGHNPSNGNSKIGYATSSDGVSWTKYAGNPVLSPGGNGGWDDWTIAGSSPSVLKDGATYKMWYDAQSYSGSTLKIGYASSSDGVSWTKYAGNPVLSPGGNGGWDNIHVSYAFVLRDTNNYKMWYVGSASNIGQIGHATSNDGVSWTKSPGNPVLNVGSSGTWDSYGLCLGNVLFDESDYKMYYEGYQDSSQRSNIGLATSQTTSPQKVAMPAFNPGQGDYSTSQSVSISCATSGAVIRYTTNEVDPTSSSTVYTGPISVSSTTTIKARGFYTGMTDSDTASATYTITTPDQNTALSINTFVLTPLVLGDTSEIDVVITNIGTQAISKGTYTFKVSFWDYPGRGGIDSSVVWYRDHSTNENAAEKLFEAIQEKLIDELGPGKTWTQRLSKVPIPIGQSVTMVVADTLRVEVAGPSGVQMHHEKQDIDILLGDASLTAILNTHLLYICGSGLQIMQVGVWANIAKSEFALFEQDVSKAVDALHDRDWAGVGRYSADAIKDAPWNLSFEQRFQAVIDGVKKWWKGQVSVGESIIWYFNYKAENLKNGFDLTSISILTEISKFFPSPILWLATDPTNLYLTDPNGRDSGVDPETGLIVNEIPNAYLIGSSDKTVEALLIPDLLAGMYKIQCQGLNDRSYSLHIEAMNGSTSLFDKVYNGTITEKELINFELVTSQTAQGLEISVDPKGSITPKAVLSLPIEAVYLIVAVVLISIVIVVALIMKKNQQKQVKV